MKKNKTNTITDWLETSGDPVTKRMVENNFYYIDRITQFMQENEIKSISELARVLEKKQPQVYRWMSGEQNITSETLAYIEIKLGIRLVDQARLKHSKATPVIIQLAMPQLEAQLEYDDNNSIGYAKGTC